MNARAETDATVRCIFASVGENAGRPGGAVLMRACALYWHSGNDEDGTHRTLKRGDVFYGEDHRLRMKLVRTSLSKLDQTLSHTERAACVDWLLQSFKAYRRLRNQHRQQLSAKFPLVPLTQAQALLLNDRNVQKLFTTALVRVCGTPRRGLAHGTLWCGHYSPLIVFS